MSDEIQALREALQAAIARAEHAEAKLVEVERFLSDATLDLPPGCTEDGNVVSLAFRAACTIDRQRSELAAKDKP